MSGVSDLSKIVAAVKVSCDGTIPDNPPSTTWRIDPITVHDAARRIAVELPATIDGRTGNSPAHQRMHESYLLGRHLPGWSFSQAAEHARALWVADVIFGMLNDR